MFKQLVALIFMEDFDICYKLAPIAGPLLTTKTACRKANLPKPDPVQVYDTVQTIKDGQVY